MPTPGNLNILGSYDIEVSEPGPPWPLCFINGNVKEFLAWAWLAKPKANVVIPKNQPVSKYLRKKRVKVRSTACHCATKKDPLKEQCIWDWTS